MPRSAVLFPGQGSQSIGMGRDLFERSARGHDVFERANSVLGFDLAQICFNGPASTLEQTDIQQPAIFTVSVATWEAFLEAGGSARFFERSAGLSLGEYTALYVAGCFSFEDGLRLVRRRGELMQRTAVSTPGGMVSLLGADEQLAQDLCAKARQGDVLVCANFNCPGQIVLAGTKTACERAVALAGSFGCRAITLAVAGAFHSPIMEPAALGLGEVLNTTKFAPPAFPVMANVSAENHGHEPEAIRIALRRQLTQPVLWQRSIERMAAEGVTRFVEMGPGRVLTGLMRKINRQLDAVNVSTYEGIGAVLPELTAA